MLRIIIPMYETQVVSQHEGSDMPYATILLHRDPLTYERLEEMLRNSCAANSRISSISTKVSKRTFLAEEAPKDLVYTDSFNVTHMRNCLLGKDGVAFGSELVKKIVKTLPINKIDAIKELRSTVPDLLDAKEIVELISAALELLQR